MNETDDITELRTTCPHCDSTFRITPEILQVAIGQVRCSQCQNVFNALLHMPGNSRLTPKAKIPTSAEEPTLENIDQTNAEVSLKEAMYGADNTERKPKHIWSFLGSVVLIALLFAQVLYYQRINLISNAEYQQPILKLCEYIPCAEESYSSIHQIKLVDRNVYTHPTQAKALMINGSFMNEAPFSQPVPRLMISLSDTLGSLISQRLFDARQYLQSPGKSIVKPGETIRFHLEVIDPGAEALTYEFEFI